MEGILTFSLSYSCNFVSDVSSTCHDFVEFPLKIMFYTSVSIKARFEEMKSGIATYKSKLDKAELEVSPLQEELQAECMKNKALSKLRQDQWRIEVPFLWNFHLYF